MPMKVLKQLAALEAKATPGPWVQEEGNFAAIPNSRIVFEVPCQGANDDDLPFLIALRNAWPDISRALGESVKLQSHYAALLNAHDGGKRMTFTPETWLERLKR